METKNNSSITEYPAWSKTVMRYSVVFIGVTWILVVAFVVGLNVLDKTPAFFWAPLIAIVIWCGSGYLVLRKMLKKKESLRAAVRKVECPTIANPLFKELFNEYQFNQLEGFTQNVFFRTWKLTDIDDFNDIISLCFSKKQHEIAIDISESEISIIIDEETDTPAKIEMDMHNFNSIEEIFNTTTAVCRDTISKMDKH